MSSRKGARHAPRQLGLSEHQQRRGCQVDLLEMRARVSGTERARARVSASVSVWAGESVWGIVL